MPTVAFLVLYVVCLGFSLGTIEALKAGWNPGGSAPEVAPQPVERVAIAVPPRPEGVRTVQGAGGDEYRYSEPGCRKLEGEHRDICFHMLARQRATTDLDGALAACGEVTAADMRMECQGDAAELHSPSDRETALAICPTIVRKKWSDQCVFGIALAFARTDSEWAFQLCDRAGMWRDFCRHDVNGEISQVDVDLALAHCAKEDGDILTRKTCWHGIGKYVARIDPDRAFAACGRVPQGPANLYVENCAHGVGWGAAESAGPAFASRCAAAGAQTDSCRLGVAYQQRRLAPDQAMGICEGVRRADLRNQCLAFVRGDR